MPSIPEDAFTFIALLCDDVAAPEITPCVFMALDDSGAKRPPYTVLATLSEAWPELQAYNARGYGIFVAVNAFEGLPRTAANVTATRANCADFDTKHKQVPPAVWPLPPSMIVTSGGGSHAYWLGSVALARWPSMQRRVAGRLGSDPNVADLPRIMRLPGSQHCKGDPFRVKLLAAAGHRYSEAQLAAAFPDERISAAARELAGGFAPGSVHDASLALAGALARADWDLDEARSFVALCCSLAGARQDHAADVAATFAKHADGGRVTGWATLESMSGKPAVLRARAALGELGLRQDRPIIWVGTDEGRVARELLQCLVARGETYVRGGSLVYVARDDLGGLRIYRYTKASLRSRLTDTVTCTRPAAGNDDAPVAVAPPDPIVMALIETPTLWEQVPTLEGIANYPVLSPSGKVLSGQGYDKETRLWVDADPPEDVPLGDAVEVLLEPFCDFPLSDQGRSGVLAAIFTIIMRPAIRGACPAFVFDSNAPRIGKKKLGDGASIIATGSAPSVAVQPYDDDEMRKRVLAILESGASVALIDDCKRAIGGSVIDPLLTAWPNYSDRRLGVSELVSVPAHTVWFFNGTNVEIKDHTANRVILIRAESMLEDPARRSNFRYPRLEAFIEENVQTFRGAAFALIRGWLAAGRPRSPGAPLGSYEQWGIVRDVLHYAGLVDPVAVLARRSTEIDGAALLYQELARLSATSIGTELPGGHRGLRASAILQASKGGFAALGGGGNPVLEEALSLIVAGERSVRRVGHALRGLRGRIIDGVALFSAKGPDNTSVWYLRPAGIALVG